MAASPLFLVPLAVSRTAGDKTRNETYGLWSCWTDSRTSAEGSLQSASSGLPSGVV